MFVNQFVFFCWISVSISCLGKGPFLLGADMYVIAEEEELEGVSDE